MAQNTPCKLDQSTLLFAGTPVEQAQCLLRPNKIGGLLDEELKKLPDPLEKIRQLLSEREPFYRNADVLVSTELRSVKEVVQHVIQPFRLARGQPSHR